MNRVKSPPSIRTIVLTTIGVLTMLIFLLVTRETYTEWQKLGKIEELKKATIISDHLFDATEKIAVERNVTYSMLSTDNPHNLAVLGERLQDSRQQVDKTLGLVLQELHRYDFEGLEVLRLQAVLQYNALKAQRQQVDAALKLPLDARNKTLSPAWFHDSTELVTQIEHLWTIFIKHFSDFDPRVPLHMRYKHFLGVIMEYTGRERAYIGSLIIRNADPTPEEQAQLLKWHGGVELGWNRVETLADQGGLSLSLEPFLRDAESHYQTVYDMIGDSFYTPGAKHGSAYPLSVEMWLEVSTQANDSLYALKSAALKQTRNYMNTLERETIRIIIVHAALMLVTLMICAYSFRVVNRRVIAPINQMIEALLGTMQGKPAPPLVPQTAGRDDEIGKLAQVLNVLQRNMEEIKRYTANLEHSNKELDDFAYIASHDLKEPLRGLHNHARFLLEDNKDRLEKESVGRLDRLIYLSQRMERLVNDLLYFSRLGRQEMAVGPTDLNNVIHDIETTLELLLAERHVKITIPKPLPTLVCDKTRTTELFRNLITNAAKYNDKEEKTIEIGFLDSHPYKDGVVLTDVLYVKDNGLGIAPEFREEVFRIFKRLQSGSGKEEEGTGVGLTFVKKIVERHGGKIWLESAPGVGTTFYFTLKG